MHVNVMQGVDVRSALELMVGGASDDVLRTLLDAAIRDALMTPVIVTTSEWWDGVTKHARAALLRAYGEGAGTLYLRPVFKRMERIVPGCRESYDAIMKAVDSTPALFSEGVERGVIEAYAEERKVPVTKLDYDNAAYLKILSRSAAVKDEFIEDVTELYDASGVNELSGPTAPLHVQDQLDKALEEHIDESMHDERTDGLEHERVKEWARRIRQGPSGSLVVVGPEHYADRYHLRSTLNDAGIEAHYF